MADLDAVDEAPRRAAPAPPPPKCPFLDTVNRQILDFDLPKVCSVTLAKHHVCESTGCAMLAEALSRCRPPPSAPAADGCLVCGKYFAGRGRHTQAYTHSVQAGHHVFINLHDQRVYCLPDLYEVTDASLDDVRFALNPTFGTPEAVRAVDGNTNLSTDILGVSYLPGFIGLNNLKSTDFLNVVVQLLAHVHPLRNYFLDPANYAHASSPLVRCFGELVRKIWSPAAFKGTVSPLEFITEVSVASKLRFSVGHPADALDLLAWLLNTLHADLAAPVLGAAATAASAAAAAEAGGGAGSKRAREDAAAVASASAAGGFTRSIITEVFQGELEVTTLVNEAADAEGGAAAGGAGAAPKPRLLPFLFLSLDLPPSPLFKDDTGGRVIQNVPLHTLLGKFDGVTVTSTLKGQCLEHRCGRRGRPALCAQDSRVSPGSPAGATASRASRPTSRCT